MQNTLNSKKYYKVQLSHIEIAVSEWGSDNGRPVIALHGWLDNMASFYPLLTHSNWLKDNNLRVISLDWPGHGHSGHRHPSHPYNLLEYVQDLHDTLQALNLEKVILLGHSMGAGLATLYAGAHPQKVEQLLLIEGLSPLIQEEAEAPEQLAKSIEHRNRHLKRGEMYYQDLDLVIKARIQDTDLSRDNVALLVERNMKKTAKGYRWRSDPRLRLPSAIRLSFNQIQAFINNLSMPVLLIYGDHGFIEKYPQFSGMVKAYSHVDAVQLSGGHHLHMEYPEAVAKILIEKIKPC
ncbi:MAG: alpha/beta hydrolase [Gammaproteobacteria bacterium]|nr:MAG: alpha/beta hydrolase [Gammaproteobacteria bacterium]